MLFILFARNVGGNLKCDMTLRFITNSHVCQVILYHSMYPPLAPQFKHRPPSIYFHSVNFSESYETMFQSSNVTCKIPL